MARKNGKTRPSRFIQFEYDEEFWGGNYHKVGEQVLVPVEMCERFGHEDAFQRYTGINSIHIVHYCPDELYDEDGNWVEE